MPVVASDSCPSLACNSGNVARALITVSPTISSILTFYTELWLWYTGDMSTNNPTYTLESKMVDGYLEIYILTCSHVYHASLEYGNLSLPF